MAHHCLAQVGMLLLALCIDIVHAIHHLQGQVSNEWASIARGRPHVRIGLPIHLTGQPAFAAPRPTMAMLAPLHTAQVQQPP